MDTERMRSKSLLLALFLFFFQDFENAWNRLFMDPHGSGTFFAGEIPGAQLFFLLSTILYLDNAAFTHGVLLLSCFVGFFFFFFPTNLLGKTAHSLGRRVT